MVYVGALLSRQMSLRWSSCIQHRCPHEHSQQLLWCRAPEVEETTRVLKDTSNWAVSVGRWKCLALSWWPCVTWKGHCPAFGWVPTGSRTWYLQSITDGPLGRWLGNCCLNCVQKRSKDWARFVPCVLAWLLVLCIKRSEVAIETGAFVRF
jgi:hypothetical protein